MSVVDCVLFDLKVGQLVWFDASLGGEDWDKAKYLDQVRVCNRVVGIGPGNQCVLEMAWVEKNGKKQDSYINHKGEVCLSGSTRIVSLDKFEKHVSKSNSIWWKIK